MSTSTDELARLRGDDQHDRSRPEPDRDLIRLMHAVRLWVGRVS